MDKEATMPAWTYYPADSWKSRWAKEVEGWRDEIEDSVALRELRKINERLDRVLGVSAGGVLLPTANEIKKFGGQK